MPRVTITFLCLCAVIITPLFGSPQQEAAIENGWRHLSQMKSVEALDQFAAEEGSPASAREARLGKTLALISTSRTTKNIAETRRQLESLRSEDPDDDPGIAASYYLARLSQHDSQAPDPQVAIATYRRLLSLHPGHPIAELSAAKLAILLLYDDSTPTELTARIDELYALILTLQQSSSQRDTRLILAEALLRLNHDHARAYPLIVYCIERELIRRPKRLQSLLLQAGESARKLGYLNEAAHYYSRYVEEFPRNNRADEVRRRLNALQAKGETS
jgi:tetratricopeptide (TPR) repeat protein